MSGRALLPLLVFVSLTFVVQGEIYPLQVISNVGAGSFCTAQEEVDAIAPLVQFPLHHHKACACISLNMLGAEGANSQLQVFLLKAISLTCSMPRMRHAKLHQVSRHLTSCHI